MLLRKEQFNMVKSILLVGVGGQGTILMSKILSEGLIRQGYDVKMCEIHGMAQRGGSVTTQIKYGDKVYSTSINKGEADVLVAFEKVEAARYLSYLKKGGTLIMNDLEIYSLPVLIGAATYPQNIEESLLKKVSSSILVNANQIAKNLGNEKAQNIVLLGKLVKTLGLDYINWEDIICEFIPQKLHELNINAYRYGLEIGK